MIKLLVKCNCNKSQSPKIGSFKGPWLFDCHLCGRAIYPCGVVFPTDNYNFYDEHICHACGNKYAILKKIKFCKPLYGN